MLSPRPYQLAAADAVFKDWQEAQSSLVTMPTGTGKTVLFATVVKRWLEENPGKRAIVVAHREELIFQARDELTPILDFTPTIEMGSQRADMSFDMFGNQSARCVIGSVASMWRENRLQRFDPDLYGLLVVDEAHHCVPQCQTYWKLCQHFTGKRLGVTATPRRGDGLAMGQAFERSSFEYEIADAIADGYLVDIQQQFVTVKSLDISQVRTTCGELNEKDLGKAARVDKTLAGMGTAIVDHCGDEPTLVFTVDVDHGIELARFVNGLKPGSAVTLSGETPADERRRQLERYSRGEFQYLLGCALFTEGFNAPRISRVVMAKPTKSIVYYTQAIGRGTRPLRGVLTPEMLTAEERVAAIKASPKPFVRVLDFVGNSGKHSLIRCADVLGGKTAGEAEERAKTAGERKGEPESVLEAILREKQAIANEEKEKQRIAEYKAKATYSIQDVDPFGGFGGGHAGRATNRNDDRRPCGPRLRELMERHGSWRDGMRHSEAEAVAADINHRKKAGLCTLKQAKILRRNGFDDRMKYEAAKAVIDLIAARGWRTPDYTISRQNASITPTPDDTWRLKIIDPEFGELVVGPDFQSPEACRDAYLGSVVKTQGVAA